MPKDGLGMPLVEEHYLLDQGDLDRILEGEKDRALLQEDLQNCEKRECAAEEEAGMSPVWVGILAGSIVVVAAGIFAGGIALGYELAPR